jgi:hypothetical protein
VSDNITPFPGATDLPVNPLGVESSGYRHFCSHDFVTLDAHTRTVQCAGPKCGAVLDPFNFLLSNAQTIRRAWDAHAQAMRQTNEVAERVSMLKKEEQRLRAMVKRLQEKSGAVLNVRNREP